MQLDDLHAVAQRIGNGVELVGGGDEQHLRQIELHVEVVVAERIILLRIERLQQRRSRVAAEVASYLVDLVQHEDRVVGLRPANALDDLPGHGADIRAAMSANLGLVMHAAQREAHELAPQGARNRFTQRGLAHARRSKEAQDRALHLRVQAAHRQVVKNAFLDLLQVVVILVQDLFCLDDIGFLAGGLRPRQYHQPFQVIPGHRIIGRHRRHARQPRQLLQRLFLDLVRHAGLLDLFLELLGVALGFVLLAQLLLDRLHLLAQVVLALRLLHAVLHLGLNLVAELLHLQLFGQVLVDLLQPQVDVRGLQNLLLVARGERGQRGGDEIHQPSRLLDVHRHRRQFVGERRRAGHDLLEQRQNVPLQRLDLGALGRNHLAPRSLPSPA